jgi:hypothetical protein
VKGNKVYSSITCVFVPKRINLMFVKRNAARGNLPIGVIWNKRDRKYQVDCKDEESITVHLGKFHTIKEAFESYKTFKEDVIKKVANKYKERIPNKLYIALLNYKVEIDD